MKSRKANQSKIASKNDCAIQYEPKKNANTFKDFYSDLPENLVRKFPVSLNKFNINSIKQYYINIDQNCHTFAIKFSNGNCFSLLGCIKSPWFRRNILTICEIWWRGLGTTSIQSCKFVNEAIFISWSM